MQLHRYLKVELLLIYIFMNDIFGENIYSGEEYNEFTQGTINLDKSIDMYPTDVRVDRTGNLWVLSNTLPIYNKREQDQNLINVKVYMTPVRQVIKGTICDEM